MSITKKISAKANIKNYSNADLPSQFRTPVIAKYGPVDSTASQTVINLGFSVDTIQAPEVFFLSVDGKLLSQGAANDFIFSSIDSFGMSSQVTLNFPLPAGLNIQAWKLGLKKETEMLQDSRFNQIYEGQDAGFQAFIQQPLMTPTTATGAPASGLFHSTVQNRKPILNLAQDLGVRLGIERIATQNLYRLQDEFGPNGEYVWGVVNDSLNRIRCVGQWNAANGTSGIGVFPTANLTDFVEITFYGTGLNLLFASGGNNYNAVASVDGGAEGSNIFSAFSTVLTGRNYSANTVVPVVSNLSLGVHTVRIRNNTVAAANQFHGFEILNETANLRINPGAAFVQGKKATTLSQVPLAFNAAVTGTRGGRVVTYQNQDGTIGQVFRPVDVAQGNLTSANHANEEVARVYHHREFGANRADDFSTLVGATSDRSFTLDDGTTTLVGSQIQVNLGSYENISINSVIGNALTFTFVGTGLDLNVESNAHTTGYTVSVDGIAIATNSTTVFRRTTNGYVPVVSGLPYGTHTLRIAVASVGGGFGIRDFVTYQPRKPVIPAGVVELADYNVMANFIANTTAGELRLSTGVLRKAAIREFTYVNGTGGSTDWTINNGFLVYTSGLNLESNRQNSYVEHTFFGTGFDFRFIAASNRSANITVSLQALSSGGSLVAATTTNFPSLVSSVYGTGVAFNNTTGVLDQNDASQTNGSGLVISGLPLGTYKVRFNNNTASSIIDINCLDIITPIHEAKLTGPFVQQNTINVGSQAIADLRKLTPVKDLNIQSKNISQALGVQSGPTTTSTTPIPMPDMSLTHDCKTGKVKVSWQASTRTNTLSAAVPIAIYVNGVFTSSAKSSDTAVANNNLNVTDFLVINVPTGVSKYDLYWNATAGTATAAGVARILIVEDV